MKREKEITEEKDRSLPTVEEGDIEPEVIISEEPKEDVPAEPMKGSHTLQEKCSTEVVENEQVNTENREDQTTPSNNTAEKEKNDDKIELTLPSSEPDDQISKDEEATESPTDERTEETIDHVDEDVKEIAEADVKQETSIVEENTDNNSVKSLHDEALEEDEKPPQEFIVEDTVEKNISDEQDNKSDNQQIDCHTTDEDHSCNEDAETCTVEATGLREFEIPIHTEEMVVTPVTPDGKQLSIPISITMLQCCFSCCLNCGDLI